MVSQNNTAHALKVLDFYEVLERLAVQCQTPLGRSFAAETRPVYEPQEVWRLLELTQEAAEILAQGSAPSMSPILDFRQLFLLALKGSSLEAEQLVKMAHALGAMRAFKYYLYTKQERCSRVWKIAQYLPEFREIEERIFACLSESGEVRDSASPELARLRKNKAQCIQRITQRIHRYTSGSLREYLSDPFYTVRNGRYVLPVKVEYRGKVKGVVHDTSASGQTLYIEPEDVLQLGNELRELEVAEREEIFHILRELSWLVGQQAQELISGIEISARLDVIFGKARLGHAMQATSPVPAKAHTLSMKEGRHPLLNPETVVPLTVELGYEYDVLMLTGPNTGGKTVALKTVGLFVLMAQSGLLLPAKEVRLGCFTQVWADIGDEQSLQQSLSTFSGHIKNISEALRAVKPGALVLLDEIGAGTDPAEGAALAKAILLNLQKRGARVLASTHYGELKLFAYNAKGFRNAAMEFDLKTLRPTYHLLLDAAGASHGLRIAERYGIPKAVVEEARSYLSGEEQEVARVLASLEQSQRLARRAQSEADRLAARLREVEKEAEKKILQAEEAQRQARTKSKEVLEKLLRELRLESAEVFESLKKNPSSQGIEVSRKKLKEIQERGEEALRSFAEPAPEGSSETQIEPGMLVRVVGYPQNGTVLSLKNDAALVQIGAVKMVVDLNKLVPVTQETAPPKRALSETHRLAMEKSQTLSSEIHLRQLRVEEAREVLEKFLDDAVLAGLSSVRIVHGKGSGVLRNMVRECLNRHHGVKNYRLGATFEGGSGVTVVELK